MNAPERTEWLARRRAGIGASDIAAVLGISAWKTPLALYLEKRGETPPTADNPTLRRGRLLEPVVLRMYAEDTGHEVIRQQEHVIDDWRMATLDGIDAAELVPVEAKTVNAFAAREFGDHGTDEVPLSYAAQVHWQMMLTGSTHGYLAALIGSDDFRIFRLIRDQELEELLRARAAEFWWHVQNGIPPAPVNESDVRLLHPKDAGSTIEARIDIAQACERLVSIKAEIKALEAAEEMEAARIKSFMGDNAILVGADGKPLATWKSAKASNKTDWKAVAEALNAPAELVAQHTTTAAGSRRFLLKAA